MATKKKKVSEEAAIEATIEEATPEELTPLNELKKWANESGVYFTVNSKEATFYARTGYGEDSGTLNQPIGTIKALIEKLIK